MLKILKYVVLDILKNKIVLLYTLLLAVLSWSVFSLEDNNTKGVLTLLNVILLTTPLVAIVFSTIYIYNSGEFIELLLSQPIKRNKIWRSIFVGLLVSLSLSFIFGAGIPILIFNPDNIGSLLMLMGVLITAVFTAIASYCTMLTRDKAKGIGMAVLLWLLMTLLFDGILLFLMFQFSDYPIEKLMVLLAAMNPVDLTRICILLQLDVSAMLGYTGAIFKAFFGSEFGSILSVLILALWTVVPFAASARRFNSKDM